MQFILTIHVCRIMNRDQSKLYHLPFYLPLYNNMYKTSLILISIHKIYNKMNFSSYGSFLLMRRFVSSSACINDCLRCYNTPNERNYIGICASLFNVHIHSPIRNLLALNICSSSIILLLSKWNVIRDEIYQYLHCLSLRPLGNLEYIK